MGSCSTNTKQKHNDKIQPIEALNPVLITPNNDNNENKVIHYNTKVVNNNVNVKVINNSNNSNDKGNNNSDKGNKNKKINNTKDIKNNVNKPHDHNNSDNNEIVVSIPHKVNSKLAANIASRDDESNSLKVKGINDLNSDQPFPNNSNNHDINNIPPLVIRVKRENQSQSDLLSLKRKIPFYPHIYKVTTNEEIEFYEELDKIRNEDYRIDVLVTNIITNNLTISSIIEEIEKITKTDLEKCFVVYLVYMNILGRDDIKDIQNNEILKLVFENRYTSSDENTNTEKSDLFKSILSRLNIKEVKRVQGYVKNIKTYTKDIKLIKNNYWYCVKINGHFRLIDPYYHIPNTSVDLLTYYGFCVLPQLFFYTHFPINKEDLLLESQADMVSFEMFDQQMPLFPINFFKLGFHLIDYKSDEVDFNEVYNSRSKDNYYRNEIGINFAVLNTAKLNFKFYNERDKEQSLNNLLHIKRRQINETNDKKYIGNINLEKSLNIKEKNDLSLNSFIIYELLARIPKIGRYELDIINTEGSECETISNNELNSTQDICFKYLIKANVNNFNKIKEYPDDKLRYPEVSDSYIKNYCELIEPLHYYIDYCTLKMGSLLFKMKVSLASKVAIFLDGEQNEELRIEKDNNENNNIWGLNLKLDKKFKILSIAACFKNEIIVGKEVNDKYITLVTFSNNVEK